MQSSLSNLISNYNLVGEINQRSSDFYHELHRFRKGDYFTTKIQRLHIPFENKSMQSGRERVLEKWVVDKVVNQNDKIEILFRCIIQPFYITLPDDRYEIRTDMGWKKMMIRVGKPKKTRRAIDIAGQRQLVDLTTISFCDIEYVVEGDGERVGKRMERTYYSFSTPIGCIDHLSADVPLWWNYMSNKIRRSHESTLKKLSDIKRAYSIGNKGRVKIKL